MISAPSRIPSFVLGLGVLVGTAPSCGESNEKDAHSGEAPRSTKYKYRQGARGNPRVVGCADGQREGFADREANPFIAGCKGSWEGAMNLRAARTGIGCGDDLKGSSCGSPADLCAKGWHLCGDSGDKEDLRRRASAEACHNAGPGRFNAAMSHSPKEGFPCPIVLKSTTLPCMEQGVGSEPVCCGKHCEFGGCRDGVYRGETKISIAPHSHCQAVFSSNNGGVLCCADDLGGQPSTEP